MGMTRRLSDLEGGEPRYDGVHVAAIDRTYRKEGGDGESAGVARYWNEKKEFSVGAEN